MKQRDFELLVAAEFKRFDLSSQGWRWRWMRSKRTFGQCLHGPRILEFSKPLVEANTMEKCLDIIIHEACHAILPYSAGHGPQWRKAMVEWGGCPSEFWDEAAVPGTHVPFKWFGVCGCCGYVVGRHRLTERLRGGYCPKCVDGRRQDSWLPDWQLRWLENNNGLQYKEAAKAIREMVRAG
jgi:predicted SprT family Zn-dependent metalloprotease